MTLHVRLLDLTARILFELVERMLHGQKDGTVRTVLVYVLAYHAWDSHLAGSQYEHIHISSPTRSYKPARAVCVCAFPTVRAGLASTRVVTLMLPNNRRYRHAPV